MERTETVNHQPLNHMNEDEELVESFTHFLKLRGSPKSTWRNHRARLKMLARFLHSSNYSYLSLDDEGLIILLSYLRSREYKGKQLSDKSVDNIFSILTSFYSYLKWKKIPVYNNITDFRRQWLKRYKMNKVSARRKLLTNDEMERLLNSTFDPLVRAIMTLFAKTGIRREELILIDVQDVDFRDQCITIKPRKKRSNSLVFFDEETAFVLNRWLSVRGEYASEGEKALFVGKEGGRIGQNIVYNSVIKQAELIKLRMSDSPRLEDRFSPHCFRHWFTTALRKNGMKREFIQELRGDSRKEAIDIYDHIDRDELKKEYLRCIPRLNII